MSIEQLSAHIELQSTNQWVGWKFVDDPNNPHKPKKVPCNQRGQFCDAHNSDNHMTYQSAVYAAKKHRLSGVGFDFTPTDPYAGVDLDNCRNIETGAIDDWASAFIRSALQLALRHHATLEKEQQHAKGYAQYPVVPGEFDVWQSEQSWGDE